MNRTAGVVALCVASAAAGWFASRMGGEEGVPRTDPSAESGLPRKSPPPSSPMAGETRSIPAAPVDEVPPDPASPPAPSPPSSAADLELQAFDLQVEALRIALAEMGAKEPPAGKGAVPNPVRTLKEEERARLLADARRRLGPLLAAYREAPAGPERGRLLREATLPLSSFMEAGGGFEHLPLLEAAAEEGATEEERGTAVIALHRLWQAEAVEFLLARTASPHAEVRLYAYEGLLWVAGEEAERALQGALPGLEDPAARVRGVVAASLPVIRRDPEHAAILLARLPREEDAAVARTLALGVIRLDPAAGRERLRAVLDGLLPAAREAVAGVAEGR